MSLDHFPIQVIPLGNGIFAVSWQENVEPRGRRVRIDVQNS